MRNQAGRVFDALGEPTRRRIVELLRSGPCPVGELARELPVGRPAVSKHLKVLSDAGITEHQAVGTSNVYTLRPGGVDAARQWLTDSWDQVLASYAVAARRTAAARRHRSPGPKEKAR